MKFLLDLRLLLLSIWLGSAVFFIVVAQSAFAVLSEQRELAGAIVNRTLSILNFAGLAIAIVLIAASFIGSRNLNRVSVWAERFMLLVIAAACGVGQFVIGLWLSMLRTQMGKPVDEVAADDPLRIQFNNLHSWSEWVLMAGMVAALIAFFIITNRKLSGPTATTTNDPFDFSKEFRKS